jgi:hypothetical protein
MAALSPITPSITLELPIIITPRTRAQLEAAVEQLIAWLDALNGDENLEENGDLEPSIGGYMACDLELDQADDEPDVDDELDWRDEAVA